MSNDLKKLDVKDLRQQDLSAGAFSTWLRRTRTAAPLKGTADVPCGECTACCKSSYFIHIAPDEYETLRRIPQALTFPAPGLPEGNVLMGYDASGRCPMLVDERCSIYEHRPKTCRNYDCRIFPAAGMDTDNRELINRQIRRWKFSYPSQEDHDDHSAVLAAAQFMREHGDQFPKGAVPKGATQLAILATLVFEVFSGQPKAAPPNDFEVVEAIVAKIKELEDAQA
jgi:Fe-S-cluster containining protein